MTDFKKSKVNLVMELNDESDFNALLSPDGYISICGFGSLLSEKSARSTIPNLKNFRIGVLKGFRRVYAIVGALFYERGIANHGTGEISGLTVEPCDGENLIVTVFEIKREDVPSFIEREKEYRFLAVNVENLEGKQFSSPAVVCSRFTDDEFLLVRCNGDKALFNEKYGKYNIDRIWRDDILPCRAYLRHCVLAAKSLGEVAYDNFLDHTFLGDRKTTIRRYLNTAGSQIMDEKTPESVKTRYGG